MLPWELRLDRDATAGSGCVDAQGRESGFPVGECQGTAPFMRSEQKLFGLHACRGRYILYDLNEIYYDFGEMDDLGLARDVAHLQRIEDRCGQWLSFHRSLDQQRVERIESSGWSEGCGCSYLNAQGRLTKIEALKTLPARAQPKPRRGVSGWSSTATTTKAN